MSSSLAKPLYFKDSLAVRAAQQRYKQIGSPFAFLQRIGIDAILEDVYKGNNIVDVAKKLNVSIGILLTWLENEGHMATIEKAYTFSAEGYISESMSLLREAQTDFELKKAKEVAKMGQFMASKMDKSKYGNDNKHATSAPVQFIMHIGDKSARIDVHDAANGAIESTATTIPREIQRTSDSFSILPIAPPPADVKPPDPHSIGPFEPEPFVPDVETMPAYLEPVAYGEPHGEDEA
jgi:hypothetical protein